MPQRLSLLGVVLSSLGCAAATPGGPAPRATPSSSAGWLVHAIALPGAPARAEVIMDYIAYDPAHHRVWVPAGNTGSVDVIEVGTDKLARIPGFATAEMERRGKKRTVGPSSATVGDGVVYVGNRGDSSVCAFDAVTLARGACLTLEAMPDGLAFVASTKEIWVTTPRVNAIEVLDAAVSGVLNRKAVITLDGQPEGFAVDDARGVFYTNLEDKDRTLTIDLKTRQITRTWLPSCGEDGPKGLALDHSRNVLFVACHDRVQGLDAAHDGKTLASLDTGDGVDNIDYVEARRELFVGAARAARLTVAHLESDGRLTTVATVATAPGARNPVATEAGAAYLTCAPEGKILVVTAPVAPAGTAPATPR